MSLSRFFLRSVALRFGLLAAFTMVFITAPLGFAQTELATVLGRITDQSGAVISGVEVEIRNVGTNSAVIARTNSDGLYSIPSLHPGAYVISVRKAGFRTVSATGLELNVQDNVVRNFALQVGSASESITVTADETRINTTDATVSTVVDRQFAENLPMNGRSFQTLIELTPGVVPATSSLNDAGQFNINGQRANANYWMVDGVSANIGMPSYIITGNGLGGTLGSFSALGGTNSLVSVDALEEFRIQTSTYAPEFGRTPGGQISIVTRSGTNRFHGTAFDYLRNDVLDANGWFADNAGLPKPQERQNDFGGTFAGPLFKNRTFFFFSYEGLRLRLPRAELSTVPDLAARQNASAADQPYLNAFPLPNGADDPTKEAAEFNATFSNPASLDAYSLRIDHRLTDKITAFARYDYSPSANVQRGGFALSTLFSSRITTQTATAGTTFLISPVLTNDFRFNYSRTNGDSNWSLDNFGGAIPLTSLQFPSPYTSENAHLLYEVFSLNHTTIADGKVSENTQRQINVVDNISFQKGMHSLKFGVDYRRLSPVFAPAAYSQNILFRGVPSLQNGNVDIAAVLVSGAGANFLFHNFGAFAQDTWRIAPRLTITYGLRWDVDFVPKTATGPSLPAVTGFNLANLSQLALLPAGTAPFKTNYGNIAPRIGIAYELFPGQSWQTVLRGGGGMFYDLADGEFGNLVNQGTYPFAAGKVLFGSSFPLDPSLAGPPAITTADLPSRVLTAFDPHLKLPYTAEWNLALEQALWKQQTLTVSYVGSAGRRLIQSAVVVAPNPDFGTAILVSNTARSDYDALQIQLKRRAWHGLQALASYTWSHSIDSASGGSIEGNPGNTLVPGLTNSNRGPSDFDIRHIFSAGATYEVPTPDGNRFMKSVLGHWSVENVIQAFSKPPVNVFDGTFSSQYIFGVSIRPDIVAGQPFYLHGAQCPGLVGSVCPGRLALNPAAFSSPPSDPNTGLALRQGDLGRNALRGFGATQWDFAVHREFPVRELMKLQFRAEIFNIVNHPNFASPQADISSSNFGQSTQMLADGLGANVGNGGFSSLYQLGGPRSVQLALKLIF